MNDNRHNRDSDFTMHNIIYIKQLFFCVNNLMQSTVHYIQSNLYYISGHLREKEKVAL